MSATDIPVTIRRSLTGRVPFLWVNSHWCPMSQARAALPVRAEEMDQAARQLEWFGPLLVRLFPELESNRGIIESPLVKGDRFKEAHDWAVQVPGGRWLIKGDHALPIAGSIKARGGVYEVLLHARDLALCECVLRDQDDSSTLGGFEARALFGRHRISVGSTGNLGLSIGLIAAALGFKATVHMSADAKIWKKTRLRAEGVEIVEHQGDFGAAVAAGREQARGKSNDYFIDDERSRPLFLGYSVAAIRLGEQLAALGVTIDAQHPLFVYLPCGVGGAPGGITFGLRHVFGDCVHCFLAEPVASPSMLVRLASDTDQSVSVYDIGLDNHTEADGLAVGRASEFVAPLMRSLVSGIFTVPDQHLFEDLYLLERAEGLRIEPSAAAALRGPFWLLQSPSGQDYLQRHGLVQYLTGATHILWTTGGIFLPETEYQQFHERGRLLHASRES